jgi:Lysozyme like domain
MRRGWVALIAVAAMWAAHVDQGTPLAFGTGKPKPGHHGKPHKPKAKPEPKRHSPAPAPPPLAIPARVLPGSAARLSAAQIYGLARHAGWSPAESITATAIALAESGGRPRAHNPVPPDDSYCLWQVNMLGQLGPERRTTYRLRSNADLYDPVTCARVAYAISGGGATWRPWTTFTRGSYLRYLALARRVGGR